MAKRPTPATDSNSETAVSTPPVEQHPSANGGLFGDFAPPLAPYVVLARKYRPQTFADLIGQDAMVQTLRNAFATARIAQGYMLTGVRGVGKTTTARILARGLNYETPTVSAPTVDMPQLGMHCADIISSRHPDVVEMDAASNTGIDNVREIIEGSRYRPISARMKVYIIDEVHMLSKGAFNALLKTLEEPPEHVKFIFATTEVRKVPVTVLSRCQRFDLRRVDVPVLSAHLKSIVAQERVTAADDAIAMIARAAEGSVRDSLSILDQAIAMAGGKTVTATQVRAMLGLSDRGRILDLMETLVAGDIANALSLLDALYRDGADPLQVLSDLSEAVHVITRMKVLSGDGGSDALSADEKRRIAALGYALAVPLLSRYWQMLQKGQAEAGQSGDPHAAAEMVLIRIAHTADLPSPDDLVRLLGGDAPKARSATKPIAGPSVDSGAVAKAPPHPRPSSYAQPTSAASSPNDLTRASPRDPPVVAAPASVPAVNGGSLDMSLDPNAMWADDPGASFDGGSVEVGLGEDDPLDDTLDDARDAAGDAAGDAETATLPTAAIIKTFTDVVELAGLMRDMKLRVDLEEQVSLVKFDAAAGSIDLFLVSGAPASLPNDLREKLNRWTARKWMVMVSKSLGAPTLGSVRRELEAKERELIEAHPVVRNLLETFPGAKITSIRRQSVTRDDDAGTG